MKYFKTIILSILSIVQVSTGIGQHKVNWSHLKPLPDKEGFAGMFAGTIDGTLFCMGGANFPGKKPWEGGTKKWYSNIYKLEENGEWVLLQDTLQLPLGYGVSVSFKNRIILVGGSSNNVHTDKVFELTYKDNRISQRSLPALPVPLANMTGGNIQSLLIIAGGSSTPTGPALKKVFALDLEKKEHGWFELQAWPGPERSQPVSAIIDKTFYLFSGDKVGINAAGERFRYILQDAYALKITRHGGKWSGIWKTIAPLPQGAAAAGNPLPVLKDGTILISGGVDAVTALHTNAPNHPGINKMIQVYNPKDNSWQLYRDLDSGPARVTLPVVYWNDQWVFVSGEVKPGIRTNTVVSIKP